MESEIDLLRWENARLTAKISMLEEENAKLRDELKSRIEELEKSREDTSAEISQLRVEVVKLKDDNEENRQQSRDISPEGINSVPNTVINQCDNSPNATTPSSVSERKSLVVPKTDEIYKKRASDEVRQRKQENNFQVNDSQRKLISETITSSLVSATPLNKENGQSLISIESLRTFDEQSSERTNIDQKIPYNQKVEQGLRRELSSYTKGSDDKINKAFDIQIPEFSLEVILAGSSEVTTQNIVDLFRVAMKVRQKEILCWYYYYKAYEDRIGNLKSMNSTDDQSARTMVYNEIKTLLPDITDVNLRKKTSRARRIYTLFSGIGIDRIQAVSYSASAISSLTDTQIQDIVNCFSKSSTDEHQKMIGVTNCHAHVTESFESEKIISTSSKSHLPELNPKDPFIIKNTSDIDALILHLQQRYKDLTKERLEDWKKEISLELDNYQSYWAKFVDERKNMSETDFLQYSGSWETKMSIPRASTKNKLKRFVLFEYDIE